MNTITVWNDKCQWREAEYTIKGKYRRATYDYPAEYPDLIIHSVICCDEDGNRVSLPEKEWEIIGDLVWEAING